MKCDLAYILFYAMYYWQLYPVAKFSLILMHLLGHQLAKRLEGQ